MRKEAESLQEDDMTAECKAAEDGLRVSSFHRCLVLFCLLFPATSQTSPSESQSRLLSQTSKPKNGFGFMSMKTFGYMLLCAFFTGKQVSIVLFSPVKYISSMRPCTWRLAKV